MYQVKGIYYTTFMHQGKQLRLSTGTGNLREAIKQEAILKDQVKRGQHIAVRNSNGMTIKAALDKALRTAWRTNRGAITHQINITTLINILGDSFLITDISSKVISELREAMSKMTHRGKPYAVSTINRKIESLSSLLTVARDQWEMPIVKPKLGLIDERNARTRIISVAEEIRALQLAEDNIMQSLLIILMDTGIRLSEAIKLKRMDIDLIQRHIRIIDPKVANESRSVPMSDRVYNVFYNMPDGINITKDQAEHKWNKIRKIMGFSNDKEFVLHAYRHTCATRLLEAGVSIYTVQKWLGHKDIQSTMRYAKMTTVQLHGARDLLNASLAPLRELPKAINDVAT
jgi:integrase